MRVAFVTNIMTPYRVPLWEQLHRQVGDLHVVTLAETEKNRDWSISNAHQFTNHCIKSKSFFVQKLDSAFYWGGNIGDCLSKINPTHLLLDGYAQLPFVSAMSWGKHNKIPRAQWFRSHALSARFHGGPIAWTRQNLLKRAEAWAVPGVMTREYLLGMGIAASDIIIAPNAVDTDIYASAPVESRSGPLRLLYVGQFLPRKGIDFLLQSVLALPPGLINLRLVGSGPSEAEIRRASQGRGDIEIIGPTRLPEQTALHYAWADVFAMPSTREVWGLVANEALASGCYLLSSKLAGATPDVVDNAPIDVGRSIDPTGDPGTLAEILRQLSEGVDSIRLRREQIKAWGKSFTVERTAKRLKAALELAELRVRNGRNS